VGLRKKSILFCGCLAGYVCFKSVEIVVTSGVVAPLVHDVTFKQFLYSIPL
jgi:hypothetical protein